MNQKPSHGGRAGSQKADSGKKDPAHPRYEPTFKYEETNGTPSLKILLFNSTEYKIGVKAVQLHDASARPLGVVLEREALGSDRIVEPKLEGIFRVEASRLVGEMPSEAWQSATALSIRIDGDDEPVVYSHPSIRQFVDACQRIRHDREVQRRIDAESPTDDDDDEIHY